MSNKWERRDKKRHKTRHGMRVTGRSLISIQLALAEKRRKEKEAQLNAEMRPDAGTPPLPAPDGQSRRQRLLQYR